MEAVTVIFALLALLIRVGQVMMLSGIVRSKNAASIAGRLLIDAAIVVVLFWLPHLSLNMMPNRPMGDHGFDDSYPTSPGGWLAHLPVLLIAGGALAGAIAERGRWRVLIATSGTMSVAVVPFWTTWMKIPWLAAHGAIDTGIAAASVAIGAGALVAAWRVGPRKGKYNRDRSVSNVLSHDLTLTFAGAAVSGLGWIALILGNALSVEQVSAGMMNVLLCVACGIVTAAMYTTTRFSKVDVTLTLAASAGSLVAAAAGALVLQQWQMAVIGLVAGLTIPHLLMLIEMRLRVDDVSSATAVHLGGGAVGLVLTGAFAPGGLAHRVTAVGIQFGAVVFAAAVGAAATWTAVYIVRSFGPLRITESAEFDGTDIADFDLNAYPDFQQTTIKSYHAREV